MSKPNRYICIFEGMDESSIPSYALVRATQVLWVKDGSIYVFKDRYNGSNIQLTELQSKLRLLDLLR